METGSSQLMQVLLLRTTLWELRMWMVYSILTESQKETHFSRVCVCCYFSRVWSTLCDPVGCNPPGSPVHGIFPARILEWVAISFSRGSSWPRDRTQVSRTVGRHITIWATREILRKRITVKTQSEKRVSPDLHRSLLPFFYSPPFPLLLHEGTELTMGKPE